MAQGLKANSLFSLSVNKRLVPATEHAQCELGMHGCAARPLSLAALCNITANTHTHTHAQTGNVSNTDIRNTLSWVYLDLTITSRLR